MLDVEAQRRLAVVLVGARNPQNIGAAARAMQDFGFSDLRVVNEFAPPFEAAQLEASSAVRAESVMRSARLFPSLAEAIADCTFVAGTTAIGERRTDGPVLPLREAADMLQAALQTAVPPGDDTRLPLAEVRSLEGFGDGKVALLFGSEKTGLTKDQLSFCSALLTIPMFAPPGRHLSMNLGQAVAVCLYELTRDGFAGARATAPMVPDLATVADRERLVEALQTVMERSGYRRRFPANARDVVVRQLVTKLGASHDEATAWLGFFRAILRSLEGAPHAEIPQIP